MPLGTDKQRREFPYGDSAELTSYVFTGDDLPIQASNIASIIFEVTKPDGTTTTIPGQVQTNGSGYAIYNDTSQIGTYVVRAVHTFTDSRVKTDTYVFETIDPLNPPPLTQNQQIAQAVWSKLEDAFDSTDGGPWLRDMTLRFFDPNKIPEFFNEALLEINVYPPETTLTILDFTTPMPDPTSTTGGTLPDDSQAIFVYATLLAVIRHLMRSYVEQPQPQGAQIVYEDRRDYLQRWASIYQMTEEYFHRLLGLWKRKFLNLFHTKQLISNKAGRLYGPSLRTRNAMRGYYGGY